MFEEGEPGYSQREIPKPTQISDQTLQLEDKQGLSNPQLIEKSAREERFTPQEEAVISNIARELETSSTSINEQAKEQKLTLGELAEIFRQAAEETSKLSIPENADEFELRLQQLPIVYGRLRNELYIKTSQPTEMLITKIPEPYPTEPPDTYVTLETTDDREKALQQVLTGRVAFVEYESSGSNSPIQSAVGRVQYNDSDEVELFNEQTCQKIAIPTPEIQSIKIEPSTTIEWERSNGKNISSALQARDNVFGVIKTKAFTLAGQIKLNTQYLGRNILEVIDWKGTTHRIDLGYFNEDTPILLTNSSRETSIWQIASSEKQFNIIDIWRKEYLHLIDNLMSEGGSIYESEKLYQFLSENMDYTKNLLRKTYDQHGDELMSSLVTSIGEKYLPLLFDPGIALHNSQFVIFAKEYIQNSPDASLLELRAAFSEHLGTHKVYRGIRLTEREKIVSQENGLDSLGYKNKSFFKRLLAYHLDPFLKQRSRLTQNLLGELHKRMGLYRKQTPNATLSVSNYPEFAQSIAYYEKHRQNKGEDNVYLFEIDVPRISLITKEGVFANLFSTETGKSIVKIGEDFEVDEAVDKGLELFVPFFIKPEWIKAVRKIDEEVPKWIQIQ